VPPDAPATLVVVVVVVVAAVVAAAAGAGAATAAAAGAATTAEVVVDALRASGAGVDGVDRVSESSECCAGDSEDCEIDRLLRCGVGDESADGDAAT
jgi:hypothetical protein